MTREQMYKYIAIAALLGLFVSLWGLYASHNRPSVTPLSSKEIPPLPIAAKTQVTVSPKSSPQDSDVVLSQTYKATVNGETISVPMSPAKYGPKGTITQEFDISPVLKRMVAQEVKQAEKQWGIEAGVGWHKEAYVSLGVTKRIGKSSLVVTEMHFGSTGINGGALKYRKEF